MTEWRYARAATSDQESGYGHPASFSACAQEPIHQPHAIQPHGVLFVLSPLDFSVTHVSETIKDHLHKSPSDVLGRCVLDLVYIEAQPRLRTVLEARPSSPYNPLKLQFLAGDELKSFDAIIHRYQGRIILELETTSTEESRAFVSFFQETRDAINSLRESAGLAELCKTIVDHVRGIIHFDRVLIYRFDEHWDGKVIAESCSPKAKSFLGYHFPESDIPAQARHLYLTSRLRAVPDTYYEPSPIIGHQQDDTAPIDLSMAVLRSVSPMHRKYSQDMGVLSSMSISLLHEGKLWGLMICGHEASKLFLSYETRTTCEFLCEVFTALIGAKEAVDERILRKRFKTIKETLLDQMYHDQNIIQGLFCHATNMAGICDADGAAISQGDIVHTVGTSLSTSAIQVLCRWLAEQSPQGIFATDRFPESSAPAETFEPDIFGVVAVPLSGAQNSFLIWFRVQDRREQTWGGDPASAEGTPEVARSFHPFQQAKRRRSRPWTPVEVEALQELVRAVVDVSLQHAEMLERVNVELTQSNVELNAFAYAASHDLKEPLRGIRHFSQLVIDELGETHLLGQSKYRMVSIQRMAKRMDDLIDALLRYAHVGRAKIALTTVSLDDIFVQVRETLGLRLQHANAVLDVEPSLPAVLGDAVLLFEVFTNLITNAIKYNESSIPKVQVGVRQSARPGWIEVFVADNGIGIDIKHSEDIFDIFRRLHGRDKYGGGNGAGLTIAKRIVERHGSYLTFTSQKGKGSTFYFQIPSAPV